MDKNLENEWKELLGYIENLFGYPVEMQGILLPS